MGLGLIWTCEGRFWGWGYFGLARDDFGAGAILDLRGTILGLGLFWTCEGRFWGWGYFGLARDDFGAGAILGLRGTILGLGLFSTCEGRFWGWGYFRLARDGFGAGAILDLRGTVLGLGLFWTCEGRFWGWGYFGLGARARALAGPSMCPFSGLSVPHCVPFEVRTSLRLSLMASRCPPIQFCPSKSSCVPKMSLVTTLCPQIMSLKDEGGVPTMSLY